MSFLVESLIHANSNYEEEWFNAQHDNHATNPDLAVNILTLKVVALLVQPSSSTKDGKMEYELENIPNPTLVRSDVFAFMECY